jgi:hypothetical protein
VKKSDGTVSLIPWVLQYMFIDFCIKHERRLLAGSICWQAVYLAGIICLQAVGVGRRNMSAGTIQYVSWQYTVCWLGWYKMMAGSTSWWAVQSMLAAVVGKVTVIKLLRYVTSYFFK